MWEISYTNLNMLLATIPRYKSDGKVEKKETVEVNDLADLEDFLKM